MKYKFPLVMQSTALITAAATGVLLLTYRVFRQPWQLSAAISFGTTAYHFLMRLAVGWLIPKVTRYDFDYRHPWFRPRRWEHTFYRKLRLRCWKGSLPTYAPEQFSLRSNSLHRIIQNMCGAELVHETIMVFSFLPLLAVGKLGELPVFLITSLGAALFDSLFVMAQRYNRPRLVRLLEKKEANVP